MVCSLVSYWHITWRHHNLDVFFFSFCKQVYILYDAKIIDNLVGNVFHQFLGIRQTYHLLLIIHSDKNATTLRIGETTYPFQIFVSPRFFIFYILTFIKHVVSSLKRKTHFGKVAVYLIFVLTHLFCQFR